MAARPIVSLHSVFLKLAAMIVLAIVTVVAVLEIVTMRGFDQVIARTIQAQSATETDMFARSVAGAVRFDKADVLARQVDGFIEATNGSLRAVDVYRTDLTPVLRSDPAIPADTAALAQRALEEGRQVQDPTGLQTAQPLVFGQDQAVIGVLVTLWSTDGLSAASQEILNRALLIALIACLIAVGLASYAIYRLVRRPLVTAQNEIAKLETGDFAFTPNGIARRDEFGHLARAIDGLRDALARGADSTRESILKSAALDRSSAALMLLDDRFTITQVSAKLASLLQTHRDALRKLRPEIDLDQLQGVGIGAFFPAEDLAQRLRTLGGDTLERRLQIDETRMSVSIRAIFGAEGVVSGYLVEWTDVTPIWRQQALIATIDDIQMRADFAMDGLCRESNDRFSQTIGAAAPDMLRLQTLLAPMEAETGTSVDALLRQLRDGTPLVGQVKLATGAEIHTIEGSLSCIRDTDGHGLSFLLLGTDITEKERGLAQAAREREASEAEKSQVVQALGVGLRTLSDGDLTAAISETFPGRYEQLRADFNQAAQKLAAALREIAENAENIRNESGDITTTADSLSRRTESTAATLEQTAAALDELTNALKSAAEGASQADTVVKSAHRKAEASGDVVVQTVTAMDAIARSSEQITSIIRVIDDIAFQTNLLALNAGVEAARAGDAGRGFAVVASEVRALAQRSSEAAREINGLIAESGGHVAKGVELVGQTGDALRDIVGSVTEISGLVSEIAASAQSQSLSLEEINGSVNKLDQSTQQNAARLEETTAASEALRKDAVSLVQTLSRFRTGARTTPARPDPAPQSAPVTHLPVAANGAAPSAAMAAPGEAAKWVDF